jgi:hypothetical protein
MHPPHCLVRKAVDVLALERVEQNPVEAHEVLNAAPKCLRMDLCPVARHWSRKVDRVELPRAGAGGLETKLGDDQEGKDDQARDAVTIVGAQKTCPPWVKGGHV